MLSMFFALGCTQDYMFNVEVEKFEYVEGDVVIDSMIQPKQLEKIDVLWAVDTSCSMNDDMEKVLVGTIDLINDMNDLTDDYRVGFINAENSPRTSGSLLTFSGPYDKNASSMELMDGINSLGDSYEESGFSPLYNFISDTNRVYDIDPTTIKYDSFTRDDASLLLFIVTDEEDHSIIPASIFNEWLISLETPNRKVDIVSIIATSDKCDNEVGYKYIDLMTLRGKMPLDLCFDDWEAWLGQSSFLIKKTDTIYLSEEPDQASIVVLYDDNLDDDIAAVETDEWAYYASNNSIRLQFEPEYGSLTEVGYITR